MSSGSLTGSQRAKQVVSMVGNQISIESLQNNQESPAWKTGLNLSKKTFVLKWNYIRMQQFFF